MTGGARILVTGGAGYVGSHAVWALHDRGDEVVVYDSLRQGHRQALPPAVQLVRGELADEAALDRLLSNGPWDGVLHFAALSLVGESMQRPFHYLLENAGLGIRLIDACVRHGVKRFILSSTAALFGNPETMPITETTRIDPGSPYGESKLMIEQTLRWADRIHGLRYACLRYFNAAGADPDGRSGEDHHPETHLIPLVIDAALGLRPEIRVFGSDYPTPDGTCIRDYVHVADLAQAHLAAFDRLDQGSVTYNLGSGTGHSVLEVIRSVERVSGRPVPVRMEQRRPGDPAVLVADSARIRADTGWTPRFTELDDIVGTALRWRQAHPQGFGPNDPAA
ncbi:UDP-glucose 4-epimerase GalE [Rhizosaccharibacter radicis]|uniref:UDP-glucose 4-epimerase n=1 Tax=Rhizosaccharibacter radicis TaxID=2782605 RepID=A0ABT1W053_9PROT|nr:UDP-glucose 4-epimerase GalE [Acetobacteraceae bacterium KSS12]